MPRATRTKPLPPDPATAPTLSVPTRRPGPGRPPTKARVPDLALGGLEGDKLAEAHAAILDQILAVAQGIRIAVPRPKRQVKQGEVYEGETVDAQGETWHVYSAPPDPALLRWCAEQVQGKAAAKEATQAATSLCVKVCVPGHDTEVNAYLRGLPADTLARYGFDAATLAAIAAAPSPG